MIKNIIICITAIALATGYPTNNNKNFSKKPVAIVAADTEDLKTAETFYSSYSTYPTLGLPAGGGLGWRGDYKPFMYGSGYDQVGYPSFPVGSYGVYGSAPVVAVGTPVVAGGNGYGWRQGVNRWA